mgnify:CR=1 FL=1
MYVFQLAARHESWLALRQAAAAANVANADTPGYAARDISPFAATLDQTSLQLTTTNAGHMFLPDIEAAGTTQLAATGEVPSPSGNNVNLEGELAKIGDIGRMLGMTGMLRPPSTPKT